MKHPAKFSAAIIDEIEKVLMERHVAGYILDPFAGVGGVHELAERFEHWNTWGVELEPEWAATHWRTRVGDATNLPREWSDRFAAVVTSPPYGNRMADKDMRPSVAATYAKQLGRLSSDGSANHLQWGDDYRTIIYQALFEMFRVLKPGGLLVYNMKNHPRNKETVDVVGWSECAIETVRFNVEEVRCVSVPGMRAGANRENIATHEALIIARKP